MLAEDYLQRLSRRNNYLRATVVDKHLGVFIAVGFDSLYYFLAYSPRIIEIL